MKAERLAVFSAMRPMPPFEQWEMHEMKNRLVVVVIALLVAVLSVGWVYPLWVAMTESLSYSQSIGMRLIGRGVPISDKAIMVGPGLIGIYRETALAWAAIAGFAWSFVLAYRCLSKEEVK